VSKEGKKFSIDGDHLTLDFVNTLDWRLSDSPEDRMGSYEDLLAWSEHSGALDARAVDSLRRAAKQSPRESDRAYRRALELRELIYRAIEAVMHGSRPDRKAIDGLNAFVKRTSARTLLGWTVQGYAWKSRQGTNGFEAMLDPVVHSTSTLLTSPLIAKIAQCQDDRGCGWLFLDKSRSHARRWCSMSNCGNRAKAKRHHKRSSLRQSVAPQAGRS